MLSFYGGIDWADDHHDICILNQEGEKQISFRISHDNEGFSSLLKQVKKISQEELSRVGFAIETNQGVLVDFLLNQGFVVFAVNPKSAERLRESHTASGKKDDQLDALCLADGLRAQHKRWKPIGKQTELAVELRELVAQRTNLVESKTRLINQLTRCLKDYYPLGQDIFSQLDSQIALDFLKLFPRADLVKSMSLASFISFMNDHNYPWKMLKKDPEDFYEQIQNSKLFLPVEAVRVKTKSLWMLSLVDQLDLIMKQIKTYEDKIKNLMSNHPDANIFQSLPGSGKTLSAQIAAHFGQDRSLFTGFAGVQRLCGTAPITKQSGQYKHVQMRQACQHAFRQTMIQYAFVSLNHCVWAKCYYKGKKKSGYTHSGALRALANKWLKIIYTLWNKGVCYQEAIFLASRQQHSMLNAS